VFKVDLPAQNPFESRDEDRVSLLADYDGSDVANEDLEQTKEAAKRATDWKVAKILKKVGKAAVSKGVGELAEGAGGVSQTWAIGKTHLHRRRLNDLLGELKARGCKVGLGSAGDSDGPSDLYPYCDSLLAFALGQKARKELRAIGSSVPFMGTALSAKGALHNVEKRVEGTQGKERKDQAHVLVEHARGGCIIAGALFVEIVVGNFRKQNNWKDGLALLALPDAVDMAARKMSAV
jgi:hypothetical protein